MKRSLLALSAAALLATAPLIAQNIVDIQTGAESLVDTLATALPFNSTVGLNWSDAYIGQLLGVPPHFGVGVTVGATTVKAANFSSLLENFGVAPLELPGALSDSLPLPAAVAEARIGGFLLPFDIGVKAGYLPDSAKQSIADMAGDLNVDYMLVGADLRFALMKGNILLPTISLGVGFNYMKGGLGTSVGTAQSLTYDATLYNDTQYRIDATAPDVGLTWESKVIDMKVQISKSLLIFTPYLGAGVSYGMTTAGYAITSDVTYYENVSSTTWNQITDTTSLENALTAAGIAVPDLTSTGISYSKDINGWAFRAFGGLSLNILILHLDVSALYNFNDGSMGGSLGVRLQL